MRKFLLVLSLLLGIILLINKFAEVEAIGETLRQGDWRYILLALGLQLFWLVKMATSYKFIYNAVGLEEKVETLLIASAGANFVNVVAPSVGVGGMAVFISEARRKGYSSARTTVAGMLYLLFDYSGFLCILLIGLLVLFRRNNLNSVDLLAAVIILVISLGLLVLLYLGMRSALAWIVRHGFSTTVLAFTGS